MIQEKEKKKKKRSNWVTLLANREPNLFKAQQKKKKSISITEKDMGVVVSNNTEQIDVDEPMATHLQDEILMDILKRLNVHSLLRFKCVSKLWKTFISEPYFKMTHLNHAKNSQKLLISQHCPKDDIFSMYCFPLSPIQQVENVQKLEFPLISRPCRCAVLACCDGLVIIIVNDNIDVRRNIYLLWNPSTGESIVLPHSQLSQKEFSRLGLGYDPSSGVYKILKIYPYIDDPGEIITLKSGSWRNIDKHPRGICSDFEGIHYLPFINEAFHWIGISASYSVSSRKYSVVTFSISNEVYGEIPLPEQLLYLRAKVSIGVSVLDGMLYVHSTSTGQRKDSFKLWVLKDYSVKESWSALFFVDDPGLYWTIPKYRFEDGEVLFWCIRSGCNGHCFRTSRGPFGLWPRCDVFQTGVAFTESLISPKSLI